MIPLKLTFQGLYSYQEKQVIDFEQLTSAGIFGIFGNTGSGKSAILEAISYALYGEIERLHQRAKRAYNMLNLRSDKCELDFEFLNFKNEKYRVTRSFRRNSRNYNEVTSGDTIFYKYESQGWVPIQSSAEEILNISYSNFKRTIIIPQGQFKEFLELGATDRTRMLEEIFQLSRFDLYGKATQLGNETTEQLNRVEGELKAYEKVSKEGIAEQKEEYEKENIAYETRKQGFEKVETQYQQLKRVKESFDLLAKEKSQFKQMETLKQGMEELEKRVNEFEKISSTFNPLLKERVDLKTNISKRNKELDEEKASHEAIEKKLNKQEELLVKIQPYFEKLNEYRKEETEYKYVMNAKQASATALKIKKEIEVQSEALKKRKMEIDSLAQLIKSKEEQVIGKKKGVIDSSILMNVSNWFLKNRSLKEDLGKIEDRLNDETERIDQLLDELKGIGVTVENYEDFFSEKLEQLKIQQEKAQKRKDDLTLQQKLADYSHALHNGEPCPLCGSEEHPNVVQVEDVSQNIATVEREIKLLQNREAELQKQRNNAGKLAATISTNQQQKATDEKELAELKAQLHKHAEYFVWTDFDKDNFEEFETKRQESESISKQIATLEQEVVESRKKLENLQKRVESEEQGLNTFRIKQSEAETAVEINKQNLTVLNFDDFDDFSPEQIEEKAKSLKQKNDRIEQEHKEITESISTLKPKLSAKEASIEAITKQIEEEGEKLEEVEQSINRECEKLGISQERVLEAVAQSIDIPAERKKIQDFKFDYMTLKNKIEGLEKELAEVEFSQENYAKVEKEYQVGKEVLDQLNEKLIGLRNEIARWESELLKKEELLKIHTELSNRSEIIKVLKQLFTAKGFVNYISGIYLRQLCDQANVRFHRITRNNLSLQVNEVNNFEIIDYLNGGNSRSVKTLSGGQTFQASLSLALALADSVQAKSKTTNNFFFIDEGFGTQDPDSVNLIFETLRNLNRENKIVGIISHVDELKERIPSSLVVTKDDEKGSMVRPTF